MNLSLKTFIIEVDIFYINHIMICFTEKANLLHFSTLSSKIGYFDLDLLRDLVYNEENIERMFGI